MLSLQTLGYMMLASTLLGTVGGAIEGKAAPGSGWYKFGALLASLGVDLATAGKALGGGKS